MDTSIHESWLEEKKSAYIYRVLAEVETDQRRQLFSDLARSAEEQAKTWESKTPAHERGHFYYSPGPRERFVSFLLRKMGPRWMRPALSAMKIRGLSIYSEAAETGHETPRDVSEVGQRHKLTGSSSNIRAAVFGINDGLISNASLIVGVAAASMAGGASDPKVIVISGTAGLFAGALSMAAGEFVSVTSQRELLEHQLSLEKAELEMYPDEEAAELALIYEARGLPKNQAESLAKQLVADPKRGLATLAREELGIDPENLGSPVGAAVSSFLAFTIGAVIPLVPFLLRRDFHMMPLSLFAAVTALFITGCTVGFVSGRSLMWAGARMVLIGGGAGLISYLIGRIAG